MFRGSWHDIPFASGGRGRSFLPDAPLLSFQPAEIAPSPDVGAEEEVEDETDYRKKDEDKKPGNGPVGVFLFKENDSRDKQPVGPQKGGGILTDQVGKAAREMTKGTAQGSAFAEEDPSGRRQLIPPGKEEKCSSEAEEKQQQKSRSF